MVNKNHRLPYRALASSYTQTTTHRLPRAPHNYKITNSKPSSLHTAHPPPHYLGYESSSTYTTSRCAHKTFTPKTLPVYCPHPPTPHPTRWCPRTPFWASRAIIKYPKALQLGRSLFLCRSRGHTKVWWPHLRWIYIMCCSALFHHPFVHRAERWT